MESRIAKGFNRLAIDLENYIRNYTPSTWIVPISNVNYVPIFLPEEIKIFFESHKKGTLNSKLEELSNEKRFPYVQLKPWYVREAIKEFFDKKIYSEYEKEL